MLAGVDGRRPALGAEGEELLAIRRRIALVLVHRDGGRLEGQRGIGVHGVGVGLDDVDRRGRAIGRCAEDVDHLRGVVVADPAGRPPRQRDVRLEARAASRARGGHLGQLEAVDLDVDVRRVEAVLVQVRGEGQAVHRPARPDRGRQLAAQGVDEGDAVLRAQGDGPGAGIRDLGDPDSLQPADLGRGLGVDDHDRLGVGGAGRTPNPAVGRLEGDDDGGAIGRDVEEPHRTADVEEGPELRDCGAAGPAGGIEGLRVDQADVALGRAHDDAMAELIDGKGRGARDVDADNELASRQVVGPDVNAGGDPEAVAGDPRD